MTEISYRINLSQLERQAQQLVRHQGEIRRTTARLHAEAQEVRRAAARLGSRVQRLDSRVHDLAQVRLSVTLYGLRRR